ncbi:hypothetical protein BDV93DRAFT_580658 [Ceratobasidium sp. AG-I]|nr:hypothetical protein BDV93DRAFT_580658 [Ceratobasidium sp. AG-I]
MFKDRTWISVWFFVSAFVIAWDAGYCLMRPRSMSGGDLHWIWKPYALYADIDYIYGLPAFTRGDGFPNAQSFMNIVETIINLAYVYYTHVRPSTIAPLLGFSAATMTLSKTILYWLQDYFCSWCNTAHNSLARWIVLFALPNVGLSQLIGAGPVWLVVPTIIVCVLGTDIAEALWKASSKSKLQ